MKRKLAVLLAMVLASTSFTACNNQTNIEGQVEEVLNENVPVNDTLVIATGAMNGVFNSFFVSNSYIFLLISFFLKERQLHIQIQLSFFFVKG